MLNAIKSTVFRRLADRVADLHCSRDELPGPGSEFAGNGWHSSSHELRRGLEVIELHDVLPLRAEAPPAVSAATRAQA